MFRSSCSQMFFQIGVLKNFAKFTRKHQSQSLFFNKVAGLRPATLLKKRLWHRCFPANFAKLLRTPFRLEHLFQLLLNVTFETSEPLKWKYACLDSVVPFHLSRSKKRTFETIMFCFEMRQFIIISCFIRSYWPRINIQVTESCKPYKSKKVCDPILVSRDPKPNSR